MAPAANWKPPAPYTIPSYTKARALMGCVAATMGSTPAGPRGACRGQRGGWRGAAGQAWTTGKGGTGAGACKLHRMMRRCGRAATAGLRGVLHPDCQSLGFDLRGHEGPPPPPPPPPPPLPRPRPPTSSCCVRCAPLSSSLAQVTCPPLNPRIPPPPFSTISPSLPTSLPPVRHYGTVQTVLPSPSPLPPCLPIKHGAPPLHPLTHLPRWPGLPGPA